MRGAAVAGALLCALLGCGGVHAPVTQGSPSPSPSVAPVETRPARPAVDVSFDVSARYPATLLYALDGAAGEPHHDRGYRRFLLGDLTESPEWLERWRLRRAGWERLVAGPSGEEEMIRVCSYQAADVDALVRCVRDVVPEAERDEAERILRAADEQLRARFEPLAQSSAERIRDFDALLRSAPARALIDDLARAAALPEGTQLSFRIIFVLKPLGAHAFARHEGGYLVQELGPDDRATSLVGIAFHELSHLVRRYAPNATALDHAFAELGPTGIVAAGAWDEVYATAFGNALAASRLDPAYRPGATLFDDPSIDAIARELFATYAEHGLPAIDAPFAQQLTAIVDRVYPQASWRVQDFFRSALARGDDRFALREFRDAARSRAFISSVPLPRTFELTAEVPETTGRLFLVSRATLLESRPLLTAFGLDRAAIATALRETGAAVYWKLDERGRAFTLVVGRDTSLERLAARVVAELDHLPVAGALVPVQLPH